MKSPFGILFMSALTFVPFEPFRFLAITNGYNIVKYSLATLLGRGLRYYAILAFGAFLAQLAWLDWLSGALAISLAIYFLPLIIKIISAIRNRSNPDLVITRPGAEETNRVGLGTSSVDAADAVHH
jgi:hypothetical protein